GRRRRRSVSSLDRLVFWNGTAGGHRIRAFRLALCCSGGMLLGDAAGALRLRVPSCSFLLLSLQGEDLLPRAISSRVIGFHDSGSGAALSGWPGSRRNGFGSLLFLLPLRFSFLALLLFAFFLACASRRRRRRRGAMGTVPRRG